MITEEELKLKKRNRHNEAKRNMKTENRKNWIEFLTLLGYDKCSVCGYGSCWAALDFHHRDPKIKRYRINTLLRSKKLNIKNIESVFKEIDKCDVLCANCHRELHHRESEVK